MGALDGIDMAGGAPFVIYPGLRWQRRHLKRLFHDNCGEVGFRTSPNPQRDLSRRVAEFQIVHYLTGLLRAIDVQVRLNTRHNDFDRRPGSWYEIGIGFIHARGLFP